MMVAYGYRKKLKIERNLGISKCPNCSHQVELSLGREKTTYNICYIPICSTTTLYAKLCPNCGISKIYKKKEYKELLNSNQ